MPLSVRLPPPQVVERGLQTSLVIEDDLRFEIFFKRRLKNLMSEVDSEGLRWDLMSVLSPSPRGGGRRV